MPSGTFTKSPPKRAKSRGRYFSSEPNVSTARAGSAIAMKPPASMRPATTVNLFFACIF